MDFRSRAANDPKESLRIEESDLLAEAASIPDPDIFQKQFREIDLRFDRSDEIFWCYMNQKSRPSYTYELGDEIQQVQDWIHSNYAMDGSKAADPLRYFVCGSRTPGIYNLGGDLKHFAACIRRRDLGALKKYARTCVHMQYENSTGFGAPIITMALVQGDALGGGFEHALAFDILVAEKSARLGLPEILFNLFPGMGAYSFLRQRLGRKDTERFILDGKLFTASELYDMGVVDILAEDGMGEAAIIEYTKENRKRFHAERAVYRARKIASPVSLEELLEITDTWAETALYLEEADVRKMERLATAQDRRIQRSLRAV
ncbi:crotonase/enoyl-CoA hydratase family protein [Parasphingorhabdus flavimaris]|jgi:DSF synthase|uniref:Crotonase/enoyl-CoA hydratase family protein n=1 Tax=Parasphingorhabdus flavimaris TaxID=266812 RepID=A0ABX2N1D1_9SPHN|nr:crotonase/enoyl-CoA hydratase family protein [Parasphingorhabdus flavimaris]NVD27484.1 crotonase/enoyl-CoA hydratase family protein [Parasphingorhabdus flavimaris]|tara:strand:- start:17526 stop:18479 length:954 start_codon:yes stop_codon:yes gene_type:complete